MHFLLRFFCCAERAAFNGAFQVLSCGVCSLSHPGDLPTHSPLQPHDDSTSTLFGAVFKPQDSQMVVLFDDYRMPDSVAPKCCGCLDLALGPQRIPVLMMPWCLFIMFQVVQGRVLLVSPPGISAESRGYVLSHRYVVYR